MQEGSLVEWNGSPQDSNKKFPPLVAGRVYIIEKIWTPEHEIGNPHAPFAILDLTREFSYSLTILREVQPPGEVDIKNLLEEPVLA